MRFAPAVLLLAATSPLLAQSVGSVAKHAANGPLSAARIHEKKIPAILQRAAAAPYSTVGMSSCAAIAGEVRQLDTALGADVDTPAKKAGEGSAIASDAASGVVNSIIPGLGLLRVVTGADKEQRRVQAAVHAGSIRRGFLKGLGLARNCPLPAAPTVAARNAKG
jgi:hypothetical protein